MLCSTTSTSRRFAPVSRIHSVTITAVLVIALLPACMGPQVQPAPSSQDQERVAEQSPPADVPKVDEPVPASTPSPSVALPLPVSPAEGSRADMLPESGDIPVVEAKPVFVTAQRESYTVESAFTATKTDTPLMETPMAVQVVPKQVMQDQRVNRLQDALQNVSGIRSNNNDIEGYVYKIRGFNSLNVFRNGLTLAGGLGSQPGMHETANLERIEVLKGPASVLFGRAEPGGLINLVTKRPLATPYYKLEQEFGSYNHYRTVWDATGPLNQSGTVGYRLSGAYQDYGSFRDFQGGRRVFLAPVLAFRPTDRTDLVIDLQYLRNDAQSDTIFPALGNRPAPIALHRSFQEANDPRDWTGNLNLGYDLTHRFNLNWSITSRFLLSKGSMKKLNVFATALDDATGVLDRTTQFQKLMSTTYATNLDLKGKFDALGAKHQVLAGVDYLHDTFDYSYAEGLSNFPINIFNPVYGSIPASAYDEALNGVGFRGFASSLVKQAGVYVQDQITIFERLHVLLGGRYDHAEVGQGNSDVSREEAIADRHGRSVRTDGQFSPRAGVLYQWTPRLSTYGSYSKSFGANNGRSSTGDAQPPERGEQFEVGTKAELLQGLSATVALFHLTKKNILTPDLTTPDPTDTRAVGESRSQGVEVDLLGTVTPQLNLIVTYAYLDTKVTRDDSGLQGNRLDNVPSHSGRVFLVYHFGGEDGLGWRVGGGVSAASAVSGDRENTFNLPAYYRLDAMTSYSMMAGGRRLTAQLNLRNLTNTKYFDGTDIFYNQRSPRFGLFAAQPLMAFGTIRMEF